ncbi:unnamed protein product, partial [Effrenium voratum]
PSSCPPKKSAPLIRALSVRMAEEQGLAHRIRQVFERFDKDGGGSLDRQEMQSVFRTLCPSFSSKEINQFVHELDKGGDGSVSRAEFMAWIRESSPAAEQVYKVILKETGDAMSARVREVFQRFDSDGGGYLDKDELSRVFRALDPDFTLKDIDCLCKDLDKGGDGKVSHKEFLHWLKHPNELTQVVTRAILRETGGAREERIKKAFQTYDATGDGSLNIEELRKALKVLGTFSEDEVRKVCADLDKSQDGEVSFEEFSAWIKAGQGPKEATKAKAILAPADSDGMEAVFYNFCGVGHADMDGKGLRKLCMDCNLLDKKLDGPSLDLIFADHRVKPKSCSRIDFFQFEVALELLSEKKGVPKSEARNAMLQQGQPKMPKISTVILKPRVVKKDSARSVSEKRIASILRGANEDAWRREVDNTALWRTFGLDSRAGRILKRVYSSPAMAQTLPALASPMGSPARSDIHLETLLAKTLGLTVGVSTCKMKQAALQMLDQKGPAPRLTFFEGGSQAIHIYSCLPGNKVLFPGLASETLQNHVPALIDLACDEGPQQPFRNLQILATQVLVQLCFGAASRRRVGNSLRMDKVKAMLTVAFFPAPEGSGLVPHHVFVVCLLLASLCDLAVPEEGGLFGQLGLESGAFGRVGFLPCLAPALAAAVRREDWPPESDVHWPAWKLTQVIERLSRHGFAHELRMCITPLTGLVVNPGDGGSRGARLAAEAMRNISCAAALDADQLRLDAQCAAEPEALRAALEALVHETPAAHDLLEVYMEGRDPLPLWPEGP